ncbi:hypothetical protein ACWCYZ_45535 [Streptomyces virginiae]
MDGTLVPTRTRSRSRSRSRSRNNAASSKNDRYSINQQVVIDANTRLVVVTGRPLLCNCHDARAYRESAGIGP